MIFLCYHGVTNLRSRGIENFSNKHLNIKEFYNQMNIIKKKCNILDINKIYYHLQNKIPFKKNSVAISFDDGFENNFTQAVPILKKLKIPAIFYICPGNIEKQRMFWVDQIESLIIKTKKQKIYLKYLKKNFSLKDNNEKKKAILKIKSYCKNNTAKKKDVVIKELIKKAGLTNSAKLSKNYKVANWTKINSILKNDLFEIGGHSMEHNILTKIPRNKIKQEIANCINLIKKRTGKQIKHFSYPEGKFNSDVIRNLKKFNILTCPIATGNLNTEKTNVFKIKRIMVGFNNLKFPNF